MNQQSFEFQFLDYIEGRLSSGERDALERALNENSTLREAFEDYQLMLQAESMIAGDQTPVHSNFSVKVMQAIEENAESSRGGIFERLYMLLEQNRRVLLGSMATLATLVVVVRLSVDTSRMAAKEPTNGTAVAPLVELAPNENSLPIHSGISRSTDAGPQQDPAMLTGPTVPESVPAAKSDLAARPEELAAGSGNTEMLQESAREKRKTEGDESQQRSAQIFKRMLDRIEGEGAVSQGQPLPHRAEGIRVDDLTAYRRPSPPNPAGAAAAQDLAFMPHTSAQSAESYTQVAENGRMLVKTDPVSTFSIDVDTASYANIRRFIRAGQLPPSDAVRIEELINYFDYEYPVQYERPFTLSYEAAPSPLDGDRVLLKLGIKARDVAPSTKGWNLVFLVDVSGSMSDSNKLPLLKKALPVLVERMRNEDRIAIVTYAGNAGVVLESTGGNEKHRILNAIDNLSSAGSTNGAGGIRLAYEIARRNRIDGGVNRVILATDGDFNVGVTSTHELIRMIEQERRSGVTLTTIGMGQGNLNDGMLEQLANKGNGNYFYLDSFNEARKVLQTDLVGNMEVVAKDVKLQIEFNPEHVVEYRLMGYDNRRLANRDFNNDAVDAGEIGSGHTVTALYELVLKDSAAARAMQPELRYQEPTGEARAKSAPAASGELAFLKIRFKKPDSDRSDLIQYAIMASDVKSSEQQASSDFRFAAAVAYFGHILKQSQFLGSYTLQDVVSLARSAKGADSKGYRQEFLELVKDAQALWHPGFAENGRGGEEEDRRYPRR